MRKFALAISCLILTLLSHGQLLQPEYNEAFLQNEVAIIKVEIHPDSLAEMLLEENLFLDHEYPATFIYSSEEIQDTILNIGFRLRGNTSRQAAKKSFKVSFNTFDNNQSYRGLEKMNLNGEHNDVSIMRSKICWEMLREANLPSSRTSHVALYINEEYCGLYLNVEHIDEEFIEKRFGNKSGNLYKCIYGTNLEFLGDNPDAYKLAPWGQRIYELKTNTEADDYSGLARFIDVLNNSPEENFQCDLEAVFNVNAYLKTLVYEILFGHWDGYSVNQNNYYLYHNPADDRFYFLSYDLDNSLGVDFFGEAWDERNIYEWSFGDRPLYDNIMEVPEYRSRFTAYMDEALAQIYSSTLVNERLEEMQALILPDALADEYKALDYGFTNDDFSNTISAAWGGHIPMSITEFVTSRASFALNQLEEQDDDFSLSLYYQNNLSSGNALIQAETNGATGVQLQYWNSTTPEEVINIEMLDDGLESDLFANDQWWSADVIVDTNVQQITYRARALYEGQWSEWSCEEIMWTSKSETPLVINEIMSSNTNFISDEFGEFDDWCELYNAGTSAIFLGNKYLSNSASEPNKWQMPNLTLEAGDWVLFWLDNDAEQGPFHANFNLQNSGDELYLYSVEQGEYRLMDERAFGNLSSNSSIGRITDGADEWVLFTTPTPDLSNSAVISVADQDFVSDFILYPNPFSDQLNFSQACSGQLMNIQGSQILTFKEQSSLDLSRLSPGIYLLRVNHRTYRLVKS